MVAATPPHLTLWNLGTQQLHVHFDAGRVVSDAGLLAVRALERPLRVIADLMPLFDSPYGARVILGGDLNVSRATKDPKHLARAEAVFAAIIQDECDCFGQVLARILGRTPLSIRARDLG